MHELATDCGHVLTVSPTVLLPHCSPTPTPHPPTHPPLSGRIRVIHELRQLVEQKEQFIALMSHELRTPLNGIIGLSNVLLMDAGGGAVPKGVLGLNLAWVCTAVRVVHRSAACCSWTQVGAVAVHVPLLYEPVCLSCLDRWGLGRHSSRGRSAALTKGVCCLTPTP